MNKTMAANGKTVCLLVLFFAASAGPSSLPLPLPFPLPAACEVPVKFTYQGNLRQTGFLVTGNRSMVFRIYGSSFSAPGTELWTSPAYDVSLSTGVFRVVLEPVIGDWDSGSLWLELEVEGNRMSPREEITASPYAVNSLLFSGKRYTTGATAPSSPNTGDLWMDTAGNALKYRNNSGWVSIGGAGHAVTHGEGGIDAITNLGAHTITGPAGYSGDMVAISTGGSTVIRMTGAGEIYANRFYGDVSGASGLPVGDDLGNHTATQALNLAGNQIIQVSALTVAGNALSVGGSTLVVSGGNVGVRTNAPQTSLDVLSSGTGDSNYTQIWRDANGVIRASMTASGKLFADISVMAGGGDNLGNHTATNDLNMTGLRIYGVSSLTGSSATFSGALGVGTPRISFNQGVQLSSAAAANYGGLYASSHVFVNGDVYAANLYGNGSNLIGVGDLGAFKGATSLTYDGNRGGYANVNVLCAADYSGSHVCTNTEILFSINSGQFTLFPANTTLWISNGPPGYVANANDCQGWSSAGAGDYGPVWNRLAAGEGFGSLNKCDSVAGTPRKFACCI